MRKGLCLFMALLFLGLASAAFGAIWNFNFRISGTMLNHPAQYTGILTSGGEGILQFTLDDTGWPGPSNPNARFDYIWTTYFATHYDPSVPGAEKWVGQIGGDFTTSPAAAPPGYVGWCWMHINAKFTIRDVNANGILDDSEKFGPANVLDGRLSRICANPATGDFHCTAGSGALNSNVFAFTYPPDVNVLDGYGNLNLFPCTSGVEPAAWGSIKSLYK